MQFFAHGKVSLGRETICGMINLVVFWLTAKLAKISSMRKFHVLLLKIYFSRQVCGG